MFVIVYQNSVILGPKPWNRRTFEEAILEDTELEVTLDSNPNAVAVHINPDLKILPVVDLGGPVINPKIHRYEGPFWNFYEDKAEMYFTQADLPVDFVKAKLKETVTANRYNKEVGGFKYTVQGTEVSVDTSREGRGIFTDTLIFMGDNTTVNWKFPEGWFTISKPELGAIVYAGKMHIQAAFDWESAKIAEIDSKTTLEELDAVELT